MTIENGYEIYEAHKESFRIQEGDEWAYSTTFHDRPPVWQPFGSMGLGGFASTSSNYIFRRKIPNTAEAEHFIV